MNFPSYREIKEIQRKAAEAVEEARKKRKERIRQQIEAGGFTEALRNQQRNSGTTPPRQDAKRRRGSISTPI